MFSEAQCSLIRQRMEELTGVRLPGTITVTQEEGLRVTWNGAAGSIAAEDGTALARGFFLITKAIRQDSVLREEQHRHFRSCGPFIDCSRGGVPTLAACKRYADYTAALGMNVLALYMEDTYTVPEYPYLGHLRGRYSQEELKELDDYCAGYGIELLPCIQTLAHMQQLLQWQQSRPLADTGSCMLIDSEETYAFIEAAIASLRKSVSTHRLHIGMDEAHDVGLGRYLREHGPVDRFQLLSRHLTRVSEICRKYDFEPMMWSDMFFRLGSVSGEYYDPDCHIPQGVIDSLPQVGMVYWDYYHMDEGTYERMLSEHLRMQRPVIFAGGNWVWSGFLPQVKRTDATTVPAMKVCVRHRVDTVLATMWGDDGQETDVFLAVNQLPLFSEACWLGEDVSQAHVRSMGAALSGIPDEVYEAFGLFNADEGGQYTGKSIVYGDLLLPIMSGEPNLPAAAGRASAALAVLERYPDLQAARYAAALFRLVRAKARLIPELRDAYAAGDLRRMETMADRVSEVITLTEQLREVHRERWSLYHKRAGWELFALRYGALIGRLQDVRRELQAYVSGEEAVIDELEAPALPSYRWNKGYWFHGLTDPKAGE